MKLEVWKCDKCGKEFRDDPGAVMFVNGTQVDPASGKTENTHIWSDLCQKCRHRLLQILISSHTDQKKLGSNWGAH